MTAIDRGRCPLVERRRRDRLDDDGVAWGRTEMAEQRASGANARGLRVEKMGIGSDRSSIG
jgi:hypothetical protein